jgi:hypothetical protein
VTENVTVFPGEYRRPREITGREVWDQQTPSDLMVWEVCVYTRGPQHDGCRGCPAHEEDERYGKVKRGCRALAEEACRVVFAVQKRELTS